MGRARKAKSYALGAAQLLACPVIVSTDIALHSALPLIAALSAFGLFHLLRALRSAPPQQTICHLWYVLAGVFGSLSAYLLVNRLLHRHDPRGHLGWLFGLLYFVTLVRARTAEMSPVAKPSLPVV